MHGVANRKVVLGSGLAVITAVALAFATTALGTGPSDGTEIAKLKKQVAALKAEVPGLRSQVAVLSVSTRIAFVEATGMHAMEAKFPTTGLTARDVTALQNCLAVVSKIAWPDALAGDAGQLKTGLRGFFTAWNAGNKDEAFTQLKAAHTAYHALVAGGYKWLS